MTSNNIEQEDIERLQRLSNVAQSLLESNYSDQVSEDALARVKGYRDHFETLARSVTTREAQHQAQQKLLKELETRLQQNTIELAETQAKLDIAIEACDIDAVALLNGRLPATQLVITSLERRLEAAKKQLATKWQLSDEARAQVVDLRRELDRDATELERVVATIAHDNDPVVQETRARHREMLTGRR